jgi:hypothetical protein
MSGAAMSKLGAVCKERKYELEVLLIAASSVGSLEWKFYGGKL